MRVDVDRARTARRRSPRSACASWIDDDALEPARALGDRLWILEHGGNPWFPIEVARRSRAADPGGAHPRGRGRRALAPRHHRRSCVAGALTAGGARRERRNEKGPRRSARPFVTFRCGSSRRPASGPRPLRVSSIAARRSCSARSRSGVALAADARPGPERELVLAAVGAAAADRARVAVRLAGGDPLQGRPHAGRQAGAPVAQVGPHVPDALAQHPDRAPQRRGWTTAPAWRCAPCAASPSVALGDQPVRAVPELQVPLHEPLVSYVGLSLCRVDRHGPDRLPRVDPRGAGRGRFNCLSVVRRYRRDRNCWCRCCDADADYGNQGGPQWSSSCRWSVVGLSPSCSVRHVQSPPSRMACAGPLAERSAGQGPGDAAPEGVAASLACIRSAAAVPALECGPSAGYRCVPIPS